MPRIDPRNVLHILRNRAMALILLSFLIIARYSHGSSGALGHDDLLMMRRGIYSRDKKYRPTIMFWKWERETFHFGSQNYSISHL